jgi:hypothetical protein
MNSLNKILTICIAATLLTACMATAMPKWEPTVSIDEFTGKKSCVVQFGTEYQRNEANYLFGQYYTYNFYAQNYNGEIRAGIKTEPAFPISGDVQIKTGAKLYTLTTADAPLDYAPDIPVNTEAAEKALGAAYAETIKAMSQDIQKMSSPYRAYTGKKAKALLKDIAATTGPIKFRVLGVNAQLSQTGKFMAGEDFTAALQSCGINL